jgi:hypothetical protein
MKILYPEYFNQYKWVGWVDNDMWLSSALEKFMLDYSDKGYSQLSLLKESTKLSWGPISVFDWNFYHTYVSSVLKADIYRKVLISVFNNRRYTSFGECKYGA